MSIQSNSSIGTLENYRWLAPRCQNNHDGGGGGIVGGAADADAPGDTVTARTLAFSYWNFKMNRYGKYPCNVELVCSFTKVIFVDPGQIKLLMPETQIFFFYYY